MNGIGKRKGANREKIGRILAKNGENGESPKNNHNLAYKGIC